MILGGDVVQVHVNNPLFSGVVLFSPAVTYATSFSSSLRSMVPSSGAVSPEIMPGRSYSVVADVPTQTLGIGDLHTALSEFSDLLRYGGARAREVSIQVTDKVDVLPARVTLVSASDRPVSFVPDDMELPEAYYALFVGSSVSVGGKTAVAAFDVGLLVDSSPLSKFLYTEQEWATLSASMYVPLQRSMGVFVESRSGVKYGHRTWKLVSSYENELAELQRRADYDSAVYPDTVFKLAGNPPLSPFIIDASIISYVS